MICEIAAVAFCDLAMTRTTSYCEILLPESLGVPYPAIAGTHSVITKTPRYPVIARNEVTKQSRLFYGVQRLLCNTGSPLVAFN
jgi:hypothetical protein